MFSLSGDAAAGGASGWAILTAWGISAIGVFCLVMTFFALSRVKPDLKGGIYTYAATGFGDFLGFNSAWGYWISALLCTVSFSALLFGALSYFFPIFGNGTNLYAVIGASCIIWFYAFLVSRGISEVTLINAVITISKFVPLLIGIIAIIFIGAFKPDIFIENLTTGADPSLTFVDQVQTAMMVTIWVFIGIEGAMVVSARARKKSEAGKATVIGLVVLLLVYVGASVLPFGYLPYAEIGALDKPAMLYVFESMAPGWGGAFISVALIVAVLGSWLSFTILPSETTSLMAKHELLPPVFNRLNKKGSPQISLIVVGACTQAFMITLLFTEDAYNFAFSMCTVAIVITWAFAAAYQVKFSAQHHEWGQCAIGIVAVAFQVVGVLFNGWSFLLLTCVGYIPGFFFYWRARKEAGAKALTMGEKVGMGAISALGVLSLVLLAMGVISF